jgi:hypothetical protein
VVKSCTNSVPDTSNVNGPAGLLNPVTEKSCRVTIGVGDIVGDVVGDVVGDAVGLVVGDVVGLVVGLIVGDGVGEGVGDIVGDDVGDGVGEGVGDTVVDGSIPISMPLELPLPLEPLLPILMPIPGMELPLPMEPLSPMLMPIALPMDLDMRCSRTTAGRGAFLKHRHDVPLAGRGVYVAVRVRRAKDGSQISALFAAESDGRECVDQLGLEKTFASREVTL